MKKIILSEEQIDYDVYNALNLFNEELGTAYVNEHFNPFEYNFKLTEDFVIERFLNSAQNTEISEPEFVLEGQKSCKEAFKNSELNCKQVLLKIEELLNAPTTPIEEKQALKKLKTYLLCRVQLLSNYLNNFKKLKNTFLMYQNIQSLDSKLSKFFEESYKEQFDIEIAIKSYLDFTKQSQTNYKKELKNKQLLQKAKQIVKTNEKQEQLVKQVKQLQTKQKEAFATTKESTTKISSKKSLTTKNKLAIDKSLKEKSLPNINKQDERSL